MVQEGGGYKLSGFFLGCQKYVADRFLSFFFFITLEPRVE